MAMRPSSEIVSDGANDQATEKISRASSRNWPGHSPFLRLPGELRNKIYEFALTSSSGQLYCREPSIANLVPKKDKLTIKGLIEYYEVPSTEGFKLYETPNDIDEANQLRYVSRQLYTETKRLSISLNNMVFIQLDKSEMRATEQFARFLHHGSATTKSLLRAISLKAANRAEYPSSDQLPISRAELEQGYKKAAENSYNPLNMIAEFCMANPKGRVNYYNDNIHGESYKTLWYHGLATQALFQRKAHPRLFGIHLGGILQRILLRGNGLGAKLDLSVARCSNYHIFPHAEAFDENMFRGQVAADDGLQNMVLPFIEGGVDTWIEEINRWYREGF